MHTPRQGRRRPAFTLIELLIVIVVIAILALIIVGRLLSATRKSREARLHDDLRTIRGAIENFQGDCGEYPSVLEDIVAATADNLSSGISNTAKKLYDGPYLNTTGYIQIPDHPGLPANPFVTLTDTTITDHWIYDSANGVVTSAVQGETLRGIPYSEL